ncbi:MAG TPA: indole-3-glycerol phosphate synthase TrpC [Nitrospinota bacterium]|nr:indole-3-glycerol phosphate synthase TrpC [Nitrospinota bacterium]
MILNKIIEEKRKELKHSKSSASLKEIRKRIGDAGNNRGFKKSLENDSINIIAEIKKASPSKGIIREDFNPVEIAKIYQDNAAVAISVLTDKKYFQGDIEYLNQIRKNVSLPLLRKDFILDEYQLYEAKVFGADAVLLIAAVLDKNQLTEYMELSKEIGLENLVEVHSFKDLEKAMYCEAEIIGINNRDLQTFEVSLKTTLDMAKEIPENKVIVSESGINSHDDILELQKNGVNAFLIGEALMKEKDIGKKLKELIGSAS